MENFPPVKHCYSFEPSQKEFKLDDGKTDQSFKAASDINNIMAQYERTGDLPANASLAGSYGDFSNVLDYHTSLLQLNAAQAAFEALPAHVRKRFGNDPQQYLDFFEDPENLEEGIKLGIYAEKPLEIVKEPETAPKTPVEPPPSATETSSS